MATPILIAGASKPLLDVAVALLSAVGYVMVNRSALPDEPWSLPSGYGISVTIRTASEAADAAELAVRNVALALGFAPTLESPVAAVSSLAHVGSVLELEEHPDIARLQPIDVALCRRLAQGATVSAAARSEHLSLRGAHRRLERCRVALGVDSNDAVVATVSAFLDRIEPADRPTSMTD